MWDIEEGYSGKSVQVVVIGLKAYPCCFDWCDQTVLAADNPYLEPLRANGRGHNMCPKCQERYNLIYWTPFNEHFDKHQDYDAASDYALSFNPDEQVSALAFRDRLNELVSFG